MGSMSGLRPPQFSEDPAWLPGWLQQCDFQPLSVEVIEREHTTFQQSVERLQFPQDNISKEESVMDKGGFVLGQLFLSGNDSSPFTCAQSTENNLMLGKHSNATTQRSWNSSIQKVVYCHLRLSLDGNSEKTTLTTDTNQTELDRPLVMQPIQSSRVLMGKVDELSPSHNSGATYLSSMVQLEKPPDKNESLKHEENVKSSDAAATALELSIAASEALVIHEIISSDPFMKHSLASTILEATLQVKQARLEVWRNTISSSVNEISEIDHLSDLDDMTMEDAYEDVGIRFDDSHGIELSVSQVKDTLDTESDANKYETGAPAIDYGKTSNISPKQKKGVVLNNGMQVTEDLTLKRFDGNTQKKVKNAPDWGLGSTSVGCHNDHLELIPAEENFDFSTSIEKVNVNIAEKDSLQANANSSPTENHQEDEEHTDVSNIVQERFQSRWYGGWTWKQREVKCVAPMKHNIPEPFVCETSFLSESADVAPDENSFVQNQDKRTVAASQTSIPSEDLSNKAKDGVLLSQNFAQSSSASLVDPLCSLVPCSMSENVCLSALDHDNIFLPRLVGITTERAKDNLPRASASNDDLGQGEAVAEAMSSIKESQHVVHRQHTSLRNYSLLLPNHSTFLEKEGPRGRSFLIDSNAKLNSLKRCFSNCEETAKVEARVPVLQKEKKKRSPLTLVLNRGTHRTFRVSSCSTYDRGEENLNKMALPESIVECSPGESLQKAQLKGKNQIANPFTASKRVSFQEREINIPEKKKLRRLQTSSKICYSTRDAKKVRRSSPRFESRYQQSKQYPAKYFGEDKRRLIFQNMEFMLTGFSRCKEKEIAGLIIKYGGMVLSDIPSPNFRRKRSSRFEPGVLPIVLCLKKLQTIQFLYGCAVMAFILKVDWLTDSIVAGLILPPDKYMILSRNVSGRHIQGHSKSYPLIFDNMGFMIHGKPKIFTKMEIIVKHGGGQVFKTLQSLVQSLETGRISMGFVIADENNASRHLKHCTKEQNIPMVSVNWIIKCLHAGKLLPLKEKKNPLYISPNKLLELRDSMDLSEEI